MNVHRYDIKYMKGNKEKLRFLTTELVVSLKRPLLCVVWFGVLLDIWQMCATIHLFTGFCECPTVLTLCGCVCVFAVSVMFQINQAVCQSYINIPHFYLHQWHSHRAKACRREPGQIKGFVSTCLKYRQLACQRKLHREPKRADPWIHTLHLNAKYLFFIVLYVKALSVPAKRRQKDVFWNSTFHLSYHHRGETLNGKRKQCQ